MLLTKPRQTDAAAQTTRSQFAAEGMKAVTKLLKDPLRKFRVLDFGSHHQANLEYFAQIPGRYYIANIWPSVQDKHREGLTVEDYRNKPIDDSDLLEGYEESFDLILAWDILNYLNKNSLQGLLRRVCEYSHKGTLFHFLIATQKFMPAEPAKITLEHEHFNYQAGSSRLIQSARYSPTALEKYLEGFSIFKLNLLDNGLQEHVFWFDNNKE